MEIKRADVVISTAGHDKGALFLVTDICVGRVLLADGKTRRVEMQKKKNLTHVRFVADSGLSPEKCAEISNRELRKLLAEIKAGAVIRNGGTYVWQKTM